MKAASLRTVLLIQAIEETDPNGELLALADRTDATRTAVKDADALKHAFAGGRLSRAAERVIAARATALRAKIRVRSPIIDQMLEPAHPPRWIAQGLLLAAVATGMSISLLDGMDRINLLAWPLVLLILWNLFVYVRGLAGSDHFSPGSALYATLLQRHGRKLAAQSAKFHAPLTDALQRFANEWGKVAAPLFRQKSRRLFHFAALSLAVGLIVGWCVRGLLFRDDAGWDSNWFGPRIVLWFVHLLYAPASALLGIGLPASAPEIEQIRFTATNPARMSTSWVYLLAATATLYVVVPRLLAIVLSTVKYWKLSRSLAPPRSLIPYARGVLLNVTELGHGVASVTPYAYTPDHHTMEGIENVMAAVLGGAVLIDVRQQVSYGTKLEEAPAAADWTVILCTLASTPDASAHGAWFAACRDRLLEGRAHAPLLIAVDESPFTTALGTDAIAVNKLAERRALWSEFISGYGLPVCMLPFARYRGAAAIDSKLREEIQAAFWTPTISPEA